MSPVTYQPSRRTWAVRSGRPGDSPWHHVRRPPRAGAPAGFRARERRERLRIHDRERRDAGQRLSDAAACFEPGWWMPAMRTPSVLKPRPRGEHSGRAVASIGRMPKRSSEGPGRARASDIFSAPARIRRKDPRIRAVRTRRMARSGRNVGVATRAASGACCSDQLADGFRVERARVQRQEHAVVAEREPRGHVAEGAERRQDPEQAVARGWMPVTCATPSPCSRSGSFLCVERHALALAGRAAQRGRRICDDVVERRRAAAPVQARSAPRDGPSQARTGGRRAAHARPRRRFGATIPGVVRGARARRAARASLSSREEGPAGEQRSSGRPGARPTLDPRA